MQEKFKSAKRSLGQNFRATIVDRLVAAGDG
jgi:hypothetical protein